MAKRKTVAESAIEELWEIVEWEKRIMAKKAQTELVGHWPNRHKVPTLQEAVDGVKDAYDCLTGASQEYVKAAYGAGVAVLYGIAQVPHQEDGPILGAAPQTDEDAAHVLEGALDLYGQRGNAAAADTQALPWGLIISTLLPYILKWLGR
jgi:hypothetical protein